ncbi:MAG: hypothetical protein K0R54_3461 [Clostridiaceae bacterium]|jgi:hypothetical protein|nr:hypothetical protein [Clostridiaceae bacterium]
MKISEGAIKMNFENKTNEKALVITLEGFTNLDTAESFVDLLRKEVAKVKPNEYSLIIDPSNLLPFKPEILSTLDQCYKLYMSFGFKHIFMVNPKNLTSKMQLNRIARSSNFTGVFVNTLDEALRQSNK